MVGVFLSPHVFAVAWLACYHDEVFQRGCSICTWTFVASEVLWIALMFTLLTSNENQFRREEMAPVLWSVKWRREELYLYLISLWLRVDFRGLCDMPKRVPCVSLDTEGLPKTVVSTQKWCFPSITCVTNTFPSSVSSSLQLTNSSVGSFFDVMYLSYTYFFCFDMWMMNWITHRKILLKEYK